MKKFYGQNVVDKMVNFYDSLSEKAVIPAEEKNPCILTVSGAFKIFFS